MLDYAKRLCRFQAMNKQSAILTESDFRAAISKQCGFPFVRHTHIPARDADDCPTCKLERERFPSLLESAEDERRAELNARDDGRSDGYGESYAERNA